MKYSIFIFATFLLCLSQPAQSADSGFYLGAGFASGRLTSCDNTTGSCNSFSSSAEERAHPRLIGGYDFNKYIGIEGGFSGLGSYKVQDITGTTVGTVKARALTLAAKGGYTFPHGFSVFGKLGLASVSTDYTADPGYMISGNPNQRSGGLLVGAGGNTTSPIILGCGCLLKSSLSRMTCTGAL